MPADCTAGERVARLRARVAEWEAQQRAQGERADAFASGGELSADFLHQVLDTSPGVVFIKDRDLITRYANQAMADLCGLPRGFLIGRTTAETHPYPDEAARYMAVDRHVLATRERVVLDESITTPGGIVRWFHTVKVPLTMPDGQVWLLGIATEITRRKQMEEALRRSEEQVRQLFEAAVDPLWDWDVVRDRTSFSPSWARMLGYDPDEFDPLVHVWENLLHPDDRPRVMAVLRDCLEGRRPEYEAEYRVRTRHGELRWVFSRGKVVARDAHGRALRMIGSLSDITERRRAEERAQKLQADLSHVSRLVTAGEMAAGLAHELNQPLTAVLNYMDGCVMLLNTERFDRNELLEVMRRAAEQTQRAAEIIRRLNRFVRRQEPLQAPCNINELVREVASFITPEVLRLGVTLKLTPAEDLPIVSADPIQIQQVMLNLMRNAVEAVAQERPERRHVAVATRLAEGDCVRVEVRDTGAGLPEGHEGRVFDAFHTTKPGGLGMGLSISRAIVEAHRGRLCAEPNGTRGAVFWFTLPIQGPGR
ncbi:MAG: PAS domain S-box protein [Phycisphaerae bacterium]|nr:PAS domain S-box protein [Phycisphaerae bacterium]NUQ45686.1 PAS domain S-box protein [Phycisphaerae bacterium]